MLNKRKLFDYHKIIIVIIVLIKVQLVNCRTLEISSYAKVTRNGAGVGTVSDEELINSKNSKNFTKSDTLVNVPSTENDIITTALNTTNLQLTKSTTNTSESEISTATFEGRSDSRPFSFQLNNNQRNSKPSYRLNNQRMPQPRYNFPAYNSNQNRFTYNQPSAGKVSQIASDRFAPGQSYSFSLYKPQDPNGYNYSPPKNPLQSPATSAPFMPTVPPPPPPPAPSAPPSRPVPSVNKPPQSYIPPKDLYSFPPNSGASYLPPGKENMYSNGHLPSSKEDYSKDSSEQISNKSSEESDNPFLGPIYLPSGALNSSPSYASSKNNNSDNPHLSPSDKKINKPATYKPPKELFAFPPNHHAFYIDLQKPVNVRKKQHFDTSYLPPAAGPTDEEYLNKLTYDSAQNSTILEESKPSVTSYQPPPAGPQDASHFEAHNYSDVDYNSYLPPKNVKPTNPSYLPPFQYKNVSSPFYNADEQIKELYYYPPQTNGTNIIIAKTISSFSGYLPPVTAKSESSSEIVSDPPVIVATIKDLHSFPPNINSSWPTMEKKEYLSYTSYLPPPAGPSEFIITTSEANVETTTIPSIPKSSEQTPMKISQNDLYKFPPNIHASYLPPGMSNGPSKPQATITSYLPPPAGPSDDSDSGISYTPPPGWSSNNDNSEKHEMMKIPKDMGMDMPMNHDHNHDHDHMPMAPQSDSSDMMPLPDMHNHDHAHDHSHEAPAMMSMEPMPMTAPDHGHMPMTAPDHDHDHDHSFSSYSGQYGVDASPELIYDHDPHDHHHHDVEYEFDHHHHDEPPPPPPATIAPEPMDGRVKKYSYYYIGRKLWYIPLYFTLYFCIYVAALIIRSIARHKVNLPNHWQTRSIRDLSHSDLKRKVNRATTFIMSQIDGFKEKHK